MNGDPPPTYREICKRFGYRSPKAANDHVRALERKGLLTHQKGRSRSLRLTNQPAGITVFRIVAGRPLEASTESEATLQIDSTPFGIRERSKAFGVRVYGDSMIGRNILDGDIVLLERGLTPRDGDVVAALIENESTLKTFVRRNGKNWLRAENPLYADLVPISNLRVQGVARAVIRLLNA